MNPFSSVGTGQITVSANNPLLGFIDPILQLVAVAIIIFLAVKVAAHYFRGSHSSIMREILFGLIAVIIVVDPFILGDAIGWLISHIKT